MLKVAMKEKKRLVLVHNSYKPDNHQRLMSNEGLGTIDSRSDHEDDVGRSYANHKSIDSLKATVQDN